MANIWTPTIVQPDIPKALMTELEFLVLTKLFDHKVFEWAVDETHPNVRTILMTGERRLTDSNMQDARGLATIVLTVPSYVTSTIQEQHLRWIHELVGGVEDLLAKSSA